MSNLAAALGWALVDLLEHPAYVPRVRAADEDLARRCALESTRLAQRSIMTRAVLAPVCIDTGDVTYEVPPGWMVATLLPLMDRSPAAGHGRVALTDARHRIRPRAALVARATVLARRDDHGRDAPAGPIPNDTAVGGPSSAGARADRRRRTGGRGMPGRLRHPPMTGRQPLLRSADASPFIVNRMPRCTSSLWSPSR